MAEGVRTGNLSPPGLLSSSRRVFKLYVIQCHLFTDMEPFYTYGVIVPWIHLRVIPFLKLYLFSCTIGCLCFNIFYFDKCNLLDRLNLFFCIICINLVETDVCCIHCPCRSVPFCSSSPRLVFGWSTDLLEIYVVCHVVVLKH